jgi:hypothetical protein
MAVLNATLAAQSATPPVCPLVSYAIAGLQRCWMPARRRYSYRFRFDITEPQNQSVPVGGAFYTLNVLLGFSRLPRLQGCEYVDLRETYAECCRELLSSKARNYMLGMALWVGAELDLEPPTLLIERISAICASHVALSRSTAQDIGMLLSGVTAMALGERGKWLTAAEMLAAHLQQHHYSAESGLFYNQAKGYRRNFSSFASQVYSILALYQFGEGLGRDWAIDIANRAAARIIGLQGPRGEWGWFYYVPRAQVIDFYEVYSVHQHGMAPAFLHHAVAHGVPYARDALVAGFRWLFGDNEMGVSMLRPNERMFYRSQVRAGEPGSARRRMSRSLINAALGRSDRPEGHRGLILREECRSYELGWILWSFGGRDDFSELTNHREFAV